MKHWTCALRHSSRALGLALLIGIGAAACEGSGDGADPPSGCDKAGCPSGSTCLQGQCRSSCTAPEDCAAAEICSVWSFAEQPAQTFCAEFSGRFSACEADAECDAAAGFRCIEDVCRSSCSSHADCASVGQCQVFPDGTYCTPGTPSVPGRYHTACPFGAEQCDEDAGFSCVSSGTGDLDAYCTADCASDAECPSGFACGTIRSSPCGAACGFAGEMAEGCAPVAEIGEGKRYRCGPLGVVRNVCKPRGFCSPCERDEDCLGVQGGICARDRSGEKICTVRCNEAASCPWGNASACERFDEALGFRTCGHRFGSCRGTGKGCEPCIDDVDCGTAGVCTSFGFSGERYCIDLAAPCACAGDEDANGTCLGHGCPKTPGGLDMICLASRGPGDVVGDRCIGATATDPVAGGSRQSCWPPR